MMNDTPRIPTKTKSFHTLNALLLCVSLQRSSAPNFESSFVYLSSMTLFSSLARRHHSTSCQGMRILIVLALLCIFNFRELLLKRVTMTAEAEIDRVNKTTPAAPAPAAGAANSATGSLFDNKRFRTFSGRRNSISNQQQSPL